MDIQLIVKVQQFEDKRIEAKASWNIKELKGKLSEIYPTSTEEQKLIYSGKLLNDTVVLKDVLREYEGQEAHTVHLVFTPKTGRNPKFENQNARQASPIVSSTNQTSTQNTDMSTSEVRQRHASTATSSSTSTSSSNQEPPQQQPNVTNIPSSYLNAFYGVASSPGDANSQFLAQQYAMQTWMHQAYTQYMNQYMTLMSSPEAFQQQQQTQQPQNFAFLPPQMPFASPVVAAANINDASTPQSPNNEAQVAPAQEQAQPPVVEQRRFPNIIQDEQENRDWLDILYSMSRLMILLCLVYFYSSPIRCLVVILIGISIYLYHIYKQNQARLNNNNSTRVNLNNVNRPAPVAPPVAAAEAQENPENREAEVTPENAAEQPNNEADPLVAQPEQSAHEDPQVPLLTIMRTFVLSFFSSIIPEAPAL